jgi:hypothetical protein
VRLFLFSGGASAPLEWLRFAVGGEAPAAAAVACRESKIGVRTLAGGSPLSGHLLTNLFFEAKHL